MNSNEFITMFSEVNCLFKNITVPYSYICKLDEIRKINKKYNSEYRAMCVYPHYNINKLQLIKEELMSVCKEIKIDITFINIRKVNRDDVYARYSTYIKINNETVYKDLTKLINAKEKQ